MVNNPTLHMPLLYALQMRKAAKSELWALDISGIMTLIINLFHQTFCTNFSPWWQDHKAFKSGMELQCEKYLLVIFLPPFENKYLSNELWDETILLKIFSSNSTIDSCAITFFPQWKFKKHLKLFFSCVAQMYRS